MKNLLIVFAFFTFLSVNAQKDLWSHKVSKKAYMTQFDDGKILLKDKQMISLLNNETGIVEWEKNVKTKGDPRFLDNLPIMYFQGDAYAVIDASSGKVIDESKTKTKILEINYYWNVGRIVLELEREKKLHVLNIDLNDLNNTYTCEIGKIKKALFGLTTRGTYNKPSASKDGSLIMVDKKMITLVTPNGKVNKRIDFDDKIKNVGFNHLSKTLYILEDESKLHFVDVNNGNINNTIKVKDDNFSLAVLDGGNTIGITQKKEALVLNGKDGNVVGNHKFKDKVNFAYLDKDSGKYIIISKKSIFEIDQKNGSIIKEKTNKIGFREIYKLFDKTFISGYKGTNEFNPETLSLVYSNTPSISHVSDYMVEGDYTVYSHYVAKKFALFVIDKKGKTVWDQSYTSNTYPSLDIINGDLLLITDSQFNYLSLKTGKTIRKSKLSIDASFAYAYDDQNEEMIMYSGKRLNFLKFSGGKIIKSKEKFKFKDFDYETQSPQISITNDRIILKGSNSIFVTDRKANLILKKHYPNNDETASLIKFATIAVTTAAIATGNGGKVISVYQGDKQVHKGSMVDGLNDAWGNAERLKRERQERQNNSSSIYPYVNTILKNKKNGIIFLDPSSGKENFSIMMNENNPNFVVDEVDGVLFYLNNTELKAIDIK